VRKALAAVVLARRELSVFTVAAAAVAVVTIVKVSETELPCSSRRSSRSLATAATSSLTALTSTPASLATALHTSRRTVGVKSDSLPVTTTAIVTEAADALGAVAVGGGDGDGGGGGDDGGGGGGGSNTVVQAFALELAVTVEARCGGEVSWGDVKRIV